MEQPRKVLLYTSYCGDDNDNCTDSLPCYDCIKMSNVLVIDESQIKTEQIIGGLSYSQNVKI